MVWSRHAGILNGVQPGQSVAVLIGPEGGFEENEIQYAKEKGVLPITLGRRILRTETAGMTVLAALMMQLRDARYKAVREDDRPCQD